MKTETGTYQLSIPNKQSALSGKGTRHFGDRGNFSVLRTAVAGQRLMSLAEEQGHLLGAEQIVEEESREPKVLGCLQAELPARGPCVAGPWRICPQLSLWSPLPPPRFSEGGTANISLSVCKGRSEGREHSQEALGNHPGY